MFGFGKRKQTAQLMLEERYTKENIRNAWQEGYNECLKQMKDVQEQVYKKGEAEGQAFMKDRYIKFMQETMLMVENDEMEIIQAIGPIEDTRSN